MGAAATDNSQQIIAQGGNSSTPDERIKISKSVSASEKENYFDITLSVTQELPATDIVLVMDISNSMNSNHSGNSTTVESDKRLYKAKNAAKAFLEEYSKTTGICKNRRIGMVQFNTNASVVFELGNVNENLTDYTNKISAITAPAGINRFTNIEGGLQLAAGDFAFTVKADESNDSEGFEGFEETASVQNGGDVDFGTATFTKHGVYKFAISENNLGKTGYTYDSGVCCVTVTVTLDESTNTLSSAVEITKNGTAAEAIEFENAYIPVPVSDELVFSKNIIGLPLFSSDFTFVLKADNSSYPMPAGSNNGEVTAKVSGEGEAAFGKITFTEPGVYSYTVSEVNEKTLGYIYDRTVYEVVYTVTDNNGVLVAERIIKTDGEIVDETVFNNVYIPPIIPVIPIVPVIPIIPIIPDVDIPEIDIPDFSLDDEKLPGSDSDNNADAENSEDEKAETDADIPQTGSGISITFIIVFIGFVLSACVLLFFRKKRFE